MPVPSGWHPGEIAAQQARGYEDEVWGMWDMYEAGAASFMVPFLNALPFLSLTTLDKEGRPWASLLCNDGRPGFLEMVSGGEGSRLKCTISAPEGTPIRECLLRLGEALSAGVHPYDESGNPRPAFQVAAVGVMLHNRRRNKMEGVIVGVSASSPHHGTRLEFFLDVTSTFGNCPKYINTRLLVPADDTAAATVTHGSDPRLPEDVLTILANTDVLFLASKHSGSLDAYPPDPCRSGNNIRGGPPGFLRTFWDEERERTCIVLPDWSGNRLMMSLGNITNDPVAGITIPVWSSKAGKASDVLHLTCDALVLANEEARDLIRGVKGAVKLWPHSWTLVRRGLSVVAAVDEKLEPSVGWSPYNPPVRLLNSEKPSLATGMVQRPTATLTHADFHSPTVATFAFEMDRPLACLPGQHIILDCFELLDTRVQLYSHMASFRGGEKDLNDDGTRSWTVSYAQTPRFQVTLRRKERGGVTPNLFHQAKNLCEALEEGDDSWTGRIRVPVLGVDGDCVIPPPSARGGAVRLAYLVAGIGLTPMLAHLSQLVQGDLDARVVAVMAVKSDELAITKHLLQRALQQGGQASPAAKVHVQAFLLSSRTDGDGGQDEEGQTAVREGVALDVAVVSGQRLVSCSLTGGDGGDGHFVLPAAASEEVRGADQVVICAAEAFARTAQEAARRASVADSKIKVESFKY